MRLRSSGRLRRATTCLRGEPIAALAGARTAEPIVRAIGSDDRYPGIVGRGATDLAASRSCRSDRAVRSPPKYGSDRPRDARYRAVQGPPAGGEMLVPRAEQGLATCVFLTERARSAVRGSRPGDHAGQVPALARLSHRDVRGLCARPVPRARHASRGWPRSGWRGQPAGAGGEAHQRCLVSSPTGDSGAATTRRRRGDSRARLSGPRRSWRAWTAWSTPSAARGRPWSRPGRR